MDKSTKLSHSLDLPYPQPKWHNIPHDVERDILDLLCALIEPVGEYRRRVLPSKGKRRRKHKAADARAASPDTTVKPEIYSCLTIGFNSTVRCLEALSRKCRPAGFDQGPAEADGDRLTSLERHANAPAAIFVCLSALPPMLTSCLPTLVTTASLAEPTKPPIRLVSLSSDGEARIAHILHQPRVGILGVGEGAAGTTGLVELVRKNVPAIHVPWLQPAYGAMYLPVKIKTSQTTVAPKADRRRKRKDGNHEK